MGESPEPELRHWQDICRDVGSRHGEAGTPVLAAVLRWRHFKEPFPIQPSQGKELFGYTVILPKSERGLEVVAYGPVDMDEGIARSEAAELMMQRVLAAAKEKMTMLEAECAEMKRVLGIEFDELVCGAVVGFYGGGWAQYNCGPITAGVSAVAPAEIFTHSVVRESKNLKKQADDYDQEKSFSADDSVLDNVRDIPRKNPEDLNGQDNPAMKVFNSFREHLLERDSNNHALMQSNRKQLKLLIDAITGQERLVNLMWSEHLELQKAFQEEKELTRKALLYSIERSGGYGLPDSQPTIREELLRSFGAKAKDREGSASGPNAAVKCQTSSQLKRRLDFDNLDAENVGEEDSAAEGGVAKNDEEHGIKFGYIGSAHFPRRLKVSFRPPSGMQFLITEIAVGAYVFSKSKEKSEILFQRYALILDQKTMWSLRPKNQVPKEILDVVATMMTDESSDSIWWMPTSFAPIALNPTGHCKDTLDFITRRFMGYVDETHKIYVLLNCKEHWFLLVVDLRDSKLVYMDSLKDVNAQSDRVKMIEFVGFFMQTLFKDRKFYKKAHIALPNIANDFDILEPYVAQQGWERLSIPLLISLSHLIVKLVRPVSRTLNSVLYHVQQ
ncbi:hypothetical protein PIB30_060648 [Stylosanthes scabra]|uniref:Ubiquitin-like protease family profile domain-containing protein n=1 Tax=Stylosanthes scabra TaxID=79078 RepID=A0ABU6TKE5_9FABA|nr:hypothetical protein [Stylosanthes scabra]